MKVFLVMADDIDREVSGIFKTKESALKRVEELKEGTVDDRFPSMVLELELED